MNNANVRYALIWLYISVSVAILQYIISQYVSWFSTLLWGLLLFIPVIFVYLIYLISSKISKHFPKSTKIITNIVDFIVVMIIQFIIIGFISLITSWAFWWDTDNIRLYHQALARTYKKERVAHFPRKIPVAKDKVIFRHKEHPWFGSGEMLLSFKADKQYIDKELAKYNFVKIEGPYKYISEYYLFQFIYTGKDENIIEGAKNFMIYNYGNCAYGILISQDNIITYYSFVSD